MRVLTLTPFYPSASDDGRGCFVAEPINALAKLGIESYVIAVEPFYQARSTPNGHPAHWIRYAAIPGGLGLASSGKLLYQRLASTVGNLHSERPFDLIHAHAALPCGHAARLLSREQGMPFVITVHGLDAFFTRQVQGYSGRWCQDSAERVYRSASRVICISRRVADQLSARMKDVKTSVVHNGVDQNRFFPGPDRSEDAIVLSVGDLIATKGHEVLLHAMAIVLQKHPDILCEIIGDGPQRSMLTHLAMRLNITSKVRFLGRQSRQEVANAMQRCAIFALPSRYEGLGCVYLEAMSAEKPAIACRGQGIEDIIRHGENGWLADPGDVKSMVDGLSALLEDPELRGQIGSAARTTVQRGLTIEHQAARLAQLYQECTA
ncbi:MAG: glycosyltransferase [Acidobacteriaceae bacterium]|nr:glycosyltransferase [Acidobacteriaceae bacterium]